MVSIVRKERKKLHGIPPLKREQDWNIIGLFHVIQHHPQEFLQFTHNSVNCPEKREDPHMTMDWTGLETMQYFDQLKATRDDVNLPLKDTPNISPSSS